MENTEGSRAPVREWFGTLHQKLYNSLRWKKSTLKPEVRSKFTCGTGRKDELKSKGLTEHTGLEYKKETT